MSLTLETLISVTDKFSKPILEFEKRTNECLKPVQNLQKALRGIDRVSGFKAFRDGFSGLKKGSAELLQNVKNIGASFYFIKDGVGAVVGVIDKISSKGDEIAKTAQRLGLTVEELQKYRYVAELAGVSSEKFTMGIRKLSESSVKALSGTGEQYDAFKALGISLKDGTGALKSSQELLYELADRYSATGAGALSASEKIFAANKIFGDSGTDLVTIFNQGSDAIKGQMAELEKFGIISDADARKSETYRDSLTRLERSFNGLTNVLAGDLLDPMIASVERLTAMFTANRDVFADSLRPLIEQIPTIAETFEKALPGLVDFFVTVTKAVTKFVDWFGIKWPLIAVVGTTTIGPLCAALASLGKMLAIPIKIGFQLGATLKGPLMTGLKMATPAIKRFGLAFKASLGPITLLFTAFEVWKPTIELIWKNLDMIKSMTFDDLIFCVKELDKSFDGLRETIAGIPIIGTVAKALGGLAADKVDFGGVGSDPIADAMLEASNPGESVGKSGLFQTSTTKTINNNTSSIMEVRFKDIPNNVEVKKVDVNRQLMGYTMSPAF